MALALKRSSSDGTIHTAGKTDHNFAHSNTEDLEFFEECAYPKLASGSVVREALSWAQFGMF